MRYYERERRGFVRVKAEIPVRYRFLSQDHTFPAHARLMGAARDLSGGGVLLVGEVPEADWIPGLLTERIFVGVEIDLPAEEGRGEGRGEGQAPAPEQIRALARAAWVEVAPGEPAGRYLMGLRFKEITRDDLDRVFRFVISRQMATGQPAPGSAGARLRAGP